MILYRYPLPPCRRIHSAARAGGKARAFCAVPPAPAASQVRLGVWGLAPAKSFRLRNICLMRQPCLLRKGEQMKLLAALIPLLMSVAGRILTALGLMAVTYAGVDRLVAKFQHAIQESVTGAPQAMLQLFYISGGGTVLNILFGAIAFILSFKQMTKLATSIGKKK